MMLATSAVSHAEKLEIMLLLPTEESEKQTD